MALVGVVRDAGGNIETLLSEDAAQAQGVTEFKDDQDTECQAFTNPPPPNADDVIDAADDTPGVNRSLIGAIAELTGNTRGQVVAAMKRNK